MKIFKIIYVTLLFLFFPLSENQVLAQLYDRFGVNVIFSNSTQSIEGALDKIENFYNYKFETGKMYGVGLGIFYEVYKYKSFSVNLGLDFIQRGSEVYMPIYYCSDVDGISDEIKTSNRINYLSFGVYSKYLISKEYLKPRIVADLNIAYMLSYNTEYLKRYFIDIETFVKGGGLGLEFELDINEYLSIYPMVMYEYDFSYAVDSKDWKFRNKSIDLYLGIKVQ
jgi:hypothetical protein